MASELVDVFLDLGTGEDRGDFSARKLRGCLGLGCFGSLGYRGEKGGPVRISCGVSRGNSLALSKINGVGKGRLEKLGRSVVHHTVLWVLGDETDEGADFLITSVDIQTESFYGSFDQ